MKTYAKVADINITDVDIIKHLGLTQQLEKVLNEIVDNQVINQEIRKRGIEVSAEELQSYADQLRRMLGLHSAEKTYAYLGSRGLELEDFENFVKYCIEQQIVTEDIASSEVIEQVFRNNKHRYKTIECNHLIVNSKETSDELILILQEESSLFEDFVSQHSLDASTVNNGGYMGEVMRGTWPDAMEEEIFNGRPGDIMGPFIHDDGSFEIVQLIANGAAQLDEETRNEIRGDILQKWIADKKTSIDISVL